MNRSTALLKSLSAERERWEKTSETFKNQMSTIAGDCLLSGAFIAYAGYFDQQMRQNLFTTWSHHLQQANIQVLRTQFEMDFFFFFGINNHWDVLMILWVGLYSLMLTYVNVS